MQLTGGILLIASLITVAVWLSVSYLIHRMTNGPFDLCFTTVVFGTLLLAALGILVYKCIDNWNTPVMWFNL